MPLKWSKTPGRALWLSKVGVNTVEQSILSQRVGLPRERGGPFREDIESKQCPVTVELEHLYTCLLSASAREGASASASASARGTVIPILFRPKGIALPDHCLSFTPTGQAGRALQDQLLEPKYLPEPETLEAFLERGGGRTLNQSDAAHGSEVLSDHDSASHFAQYLAAWNIAWGILWSR